MKVTLNSAVEYLLKRKHYFNVAKLSNNNEDIKPFIELVFLYNMLPLRWRQKDEWQDIKTYILWQIEETDFHEKLNNNIVAMAGIAILEEFLLIHRASKFRDVLTKLVEDEKRDLSFERTPFRYMDLKYSLNQAGIKDNLPNYKDIYNETLLGKGLSAYYFTPMSMYSITHTIFYLTNMGRNDKYLSLLKNKKGVLRNLLTENIIRNDLDILAEVLMCCFFVGLENDEETLELIIYGVNFIAANQLSDGSFPAPIESKTFLDNKGKFSLRYHTTLVCIGALICYMEKI